MDTRRCRSVTEIASMWALAATLLMISSGVLGILTIIEVKISFANQYDGMTFQLLNTAHAPWEFSHMGLSIRIITHQLQWFVFLRILPL